VEEIGVGPSSFPPKREIPLIPQSTEKDDSRKGAKAQSCILLRTFAPLRENLS
jgi:hypothetical protein